MCYYYLFMLGISFDLLAFPFYSWLKPLKFLKFFNFLVPYSTDLKNKIPELFVKFSNNNIGSHRLKQCHKKFSINYCLEHCLHCVCVLGVLKKNKVSRLMIRKHDFTVPKNGTDKIDDRVGYSRIFH